MKDDVFQSVTKAYSIGVCLVYDKVVVMEKKLFYQVYANSVNRFVVWKHILPLFYPQGALKVRRRVTVMLIIVSAIFGISWGTSSVAYILKHYTSYNIGNVAITNTMALFNSAVNPYLYALLNQQFRQKAKLTICCTVRPTRRIYSRRNGTQNSKSVPSNIVLPNQRMETVS